MGHAILTINWLIARRSIFIILSLLALPVNAGSLTSSFSLTPPVNVSLENEGTVDWAHWGLNNSTSFNHKAGVTQQISDFTRIGSTQENRFTSARSIYDWTNGIPTSTNTGSTTGVYIPGLGNGFSLTLPVDTSTRTLKLYLGGWDAVGRLQVSLSDNSAPTIDTSFGQQNQVFDRVVTINFSANSGGQSLLVQYTIANNFSGGNISLQAATLVGGGSNQAPSFTPSINDQSVAVGNTLSFPVTANDTDGPLPLDISISNAVPALPSTVVFTNSGGGSGSFDWTPSAGEEGSYSVTFRAQDGDGAFAEQTINITVNGSGGGGGSNQAPIFTPSINDQSVAVGNTLNFSVTANDTDGPLPLDISISNAVPALPSTVVYTNSGL